MSSLAVLLVVILGSTCLLLWWLAARMVKQVTRDAVRVPAEVIGFESYMSRGRTMYFPRYRATLPDGQTLEAACGTTAKTWQSPRVGTRVVLRYREADTKLPLVETGFMPFLVPLILFVVGAIPGVLALVIGILNGRHR